MGLSASSTSWRSPGAILDAQPAQAAYEVSRTSVWVCLAIAVLRRVRRGLRFDELDEGLGERRAAPVTVGDQIERAPDAQILHRRDEGEPWRLEPMRRQIEMSGYLPLNRPISAGSTYSPGIVEPPTTSSPDMRPWNWSSACCASRWSASRRRA